MPDASPDINVSRRAEDIDDERIKNRSSVDEEILRRKLMESIDVNGLTAWNKVYVTGGVIAVFTMLFIAIITAFVWQQHSMMSNIYESLKYDREAYRQDITNHHKSLKEERELSRQDASERWKSLGEHTRAITKMTEAVNKVCDKVGVIAGDIPLANETKPRITDAKPEQSDSSRKDGH